MLLDISLERSFFCPNNSFDSALYIDMGNGVLDKSSFLHLVDFQMSQIIFMPLG